MERASYKIGTKLSSWYVGVSIRDESFVVLLDLERPAEELPQEVLDELVKQLRIRFVTEDVAVESVQPAWKSMWWEVGGPIEYMVSPE